MPPDPWKLLRTDELTDEQRKKLWKKLKVREQNLKLAMDAVEKALSLLSKSLDQEGQAKYARKIKQARKKK